MTNVLFERKILDDLRAYHASTSHRLESGGLLLGYRKGPDLQVVDVTYPSRWDRATPVMFWRSAIGHRRPAFRAWRASGGTIDWIGEWHTHPGGAATPSFTDRSSWQKIALHRGAAMTFLIIADFGRYVGVQLSDQHKELPFIIEETSHKVLYSI